MSFVSCRQSLGRLLQRFAAWVYGPVPSVDVVTLTVPKDALYSVACALCHYADTLHGSSFGEAKRHYVYAQLEKTFPEQSAQDRALLIEAAVRA